MPKSKARKNVDENFKVAAVQRLQTGGVLANDLAKELGVSIWSLRRWSREYRKRTAAGAGAARVRAPCRNSSSACHIRRSDVVGAAIGRFRNSGGIIFVREDLELIA